MKLDISGNATIRDIQEAFHSNYPFLKLEFFDKPHEKGELSRNSHIYDPSFSLKHISRLQETGNITIHPWHKTGDVEEAFRDHFGLNIQVYRREGDAWIQTAGTDEFSLDEQNRIGRSIAERREGNAWIEREIIY